MYMPAVVKEGRGASLVGARHLQSAAQGSSQAVRRQLMADTGPQAVQLCSMQRMLNDSPRNMRMQELAQTIQRKPSPATVTWGVTHVVKKQGDSLFGRDSYEDGEIGLPGELTHGSKLVLDDEDIFTSRRGANQEQPSIRDSQRTEAPSHQWIRVLKIGRADVEPLNVYIRLETVAFHKTEESQLRQIHVREVDWDHSDIDTAAAEMGEEWIGLRGGPPKDVGQHKCSESDWNQNDEGADVADDLQVPEERRPAPTPDDGYSKLFVAYYADDEQQKPIAIMQLEMRVEEKGSDDSHLYIRWLLGSPTKQGGGSTLTTYAKVAAIKEAEGRLRVDSAMSAEAWYNKQGFVTLYDAEHGTDYENFGQEEQDKMPAVKCGCKFMKWTMESF